MIKIGSRKSPLAMRQAEEVLLKLKNAFPDEEFEVSGISTEGDRASETPLKSFGGKGVFIKELEAALLCGEIQMAVHSAKDMPTELPDGLAIGAALTRGAHEDVLLRLKGADAPRVIGTGSARREVQLRELFPDAEIRPIRGNIHSRIEKLKSGAYDAIVTAKAALDRLEIHDDALEVTVLDFICAAGQGIIAVEIKKGEAEVYADAVNDKNALLALTAEREFLKAVGGGCHSPVGAYAEVENGIITLKTLRGENGKLIRREASGTNPALTARKLIK